MYVKRVQRIKGRVFQIQRLHNLEITQEVPRAEKSKDGEIAHFHKLCPNDDLEMGNMNAGMLMSEWLSSGQAFHTPRPQTPRPRPQTPRPRPQTPQPKPQPPASMRNLTMAIRKHHSNLLPKTCQKALQHL